jgi:hypothetical protein
MDSELAVGTMAHDEESEAGEGLLIHPESKFYEFLPLLRRRNQAFEVVAAF